MNDLREQIADIEKDMLKRQIAMHSMLKSGLINDPNPEKSDVAVSIPGMRGSADETLNGDAKSDADSYVVEKANYLGKKALREALKAKLQASELAHGRK